jgi:hypothetical protein
MCFDKRAEGIFSDTFPDFIREVSSTTNNIDLNQVKLFRIKNLPPEPPIHPPLVLKQRKTILLQFIHPIR